MVLVDYFRAKITDLFPHNKDPNCASFPKIENGPEKTLGNFENVTPIAVYIFFFVGVNWQSLEARKSH